MAAEVMTYDSLLDDVERYANRSSDAVFIAQIPRLVMLAENRIAAEVRGLGFLKAVTDSFIINQQVFSKPARWRETYSFNYGDGASNAERVFLKLRSYEFCRTYWPNPTLYDAPKFYSDYDYTHWLLTPTPDAAYPFELLYHERPLPLSDDNQTSWTTEYQPQLILYATMLEAMIFLKDDSRKAMWQGEYDRAAQQVQFEEKKRESDREANTEKTT